jgi:hypothetical protein
MAYQRQNQNPGIEPNTNDLTDKHGLGIRQDGFAQVTNIFAHHQRQANHHRGRNQGDAKIVIFDFSPFIDFGKRKQKQSGRSYEQQSNQDPNYHKHHRIE